MADKSRTLCRIAFAVFATLFPTFFFAFRIDVRAFAPMLSSPPFFFFGVASSAMAAGCAKCACVVRSVWCALVVVLH